jgi:hypothetical protein
MNTMLRLCVPSIFNIFEEDIHKPKFMSRNQSQVLLHAQKDKVKHGSPKLKIIAPCRVGNGILKLKPAKQAYYEERFHEISAPLCFFIPASGSGSRMFDFLQVELALGEPELATKTKEFVDQLKDFAFYKALNPAQKQRISTFHSHRELINFILKDDESGIGLGKLPKGLVPFHSYEQGQSSAFIEHLRQGTALSEKLVNFHFTIQNSHHEVFKEALSNFTSGQQDKPEVGFSFQDHETDSFVFDEHQEPLMNADSSYLRRPSGHGALLGNLNALKEQFILIKNIDNVQHGDQAKAGILIWRVLCGILHTVKCQLKDLKGNADYTKLKAVGEEFDLFSPEEIEAAKDESFLKKIINRPIRICGMVLNEGKAGGGPFHVDFNGIRSKQIVEGVQVTGAEQQRVFNSSTHFNPVMMAMDTYDLEGEKIDLTKFSNDEQYFVVRKNFEGQEVTFIERPGLWNGSMFSWNTIFIEIPPETFTPVKTVLDLLKPAHQPY